MRAHMKFLVLAALFVSVTGLAAMGKVSAAENDFWRDRFTREAPDQWAKYRMRAKRLQGSCLAIVTAIQSPTDKHVVHKSYQEFKQANGCAFFLKQRMVASSKDVGNGDLQVANPRYCFRLHRSTPDGNWAVSRVSKDLSNSAALGEPMWWIETVATLPVTLGGIHPSLSNIPVVPDSTELTLKQVTPVLVEGRQLIKAEFTYLPENPKASPLREGWALFDPDHYWVVRRFEVVTEWLGPDGSSAKGADTVAFSYREIGDGFPILKQIVQTRKVLDLGQNTEWTYEYNFREEDVPERDFTLPAFGFPDPKDFAPQRSQWHVWATLVGFGCLGLAILVRWMVTRRV